MRSIVSISFAFASIPRVPLLRHHGIEFAARRDCFWDFLWRWWTDNGCELPPLLSMGRWLSKSNRAFFSEFLNIRHPIHTSKAHVKWHRHFSLSALAVSVFFNTSRKSLKVIHRQRIMWPLYLRILIILGPLWNWQMHASAILLCTLL